jgi:hypothetical protein
MVRARHGTADRIGATLIILETTMTDDFTQHPDYPRPGCTEPACGWSDPCEGCYDAACAAEEAGHGQPTDGHHEGDAPPTIGHWWDTSAGHRLAATEHDAYRELMSGPDPRWRR